MVASTSSLLIITKSGAEDEGPKGHQQSEGGMKYTQNTAERQKTFFFPFFFLPSSKGWLIPECIFMFILLNKYSDRQTKQTDQFN